MYIFAAEVGLLGRPTEVILYVGKTTSLRERLRSYVRIKKGYDSSRPEITRMFETYGEAAKMHFSASSVDQIARLERAIYETTMPEFNLMAPPAG